MKKFEFFPLKYIEDQRGSVLHFIKKNDPFFDKFGECYFSWTNPEYVKGWYRHTALISCMTSPTANSRVVLFDDAEQANTWINRKNTLAPFNGLTPKEYMLEGGIVRLADVRKFLDFWRGY